MSAASCLLEYEGVHYANVYPADVLDRAKSFTFRSDDIVIASYPKSGGISVSELVWLIMNDADFTRAGQRNLRGRVPIIELKPPGHPPVMDHLDEAPSPRVLATFLYDHFYREQFTKADCKVLLLLRNPKDVLVSFYHFYRMCLCCGKFEGSWSEFFEMFKNKVLNLGDWFEHVASWLDGNKGRKNFKIATFEDFLSDPKAFIVDMAAFCGKELSGEIVEKIAEHLKFENMAENPTTNMRDIPAYDQDVSPFFRKGEVGDWTNYFTPEQNQFVDDLYEKHIRARGVELKFE